MSHEQTDVERSVRERYSDAARAREAALCCPVSYDPRYLEVIPAEVLERDYGCGDPTRYVRKGESVLDLGSGGGKACFIASQVVGPDGAVIGVDVNDDMLALAERHRHAVGDAIGWHNISFRKARIENLRGVVDDASVDVIVSNCVLNLVRTELKDELFREMYRVVRPTGRAVISDIVSDRDVPETLRNDPELWSGCVSGAFREDRFLDAFRRAGFSKVAVVDRGAEPWRVVEGIEFRSVTVQADREAAACCGG